MYLFLRCALFLSEVFSQKKKKTTTTNFSILFVLAEPFQREEGQKTPCPVEPCVASWANAIKEILLKQFLKNHAGNLIRTKDPWGLEGHRFSHSNFTPLQVLLKNKTTVALKYSRKRSLAVWKNRWNRISEMLIILETRWRVWVILFSLFLGMFENFRNKGEKTERETERQIQRERNGEIENIKRHLIIKSKKQKEKP